MANLPESSTWENSIYQIEETDVVRGGPVASGGISNKQSQQLANRTLWLKNNMGGILRLQGIKTINANKTLDETHIGNLIILTAKVKITLPNPGSIPENSIILITSNVSSGKQSTVTGAGVSVYLGFEEKVWLANDGTNWQIIMREGNFNTVGDVVYGYKVIPNTVEAKGQLLSRTDYPRLWDFVSDGNVPLADDAYWLSSINYQGMFSRGNGSTNFRVPDLRGMFIRGFDSGRGIDLDRYHNSLGGYEADELKKHDHLLVTNNGGESGYDELTILNHRTSTENYRYTLVGNNNPPNIFHSSKEGGGETRPKNVGLLPLIKV